MWSSWRLRSPLMAASSSGSKLPTVIAVRNIDGASEGSVRGARIVPGSGAGEGIPGKLRLNGRDWSRDGSFPGIPSPAPLLQQPLDDSRPGLGEVDPVVSAAAGTEDPPVAQLLGQ